MLRSETKPKSYLEKEKKRKRKMKLLGPNPQKKGSVAPLGALLICVCAFSGGGPSVLRTVPGGLWMLV